MQGKRAEMTDTEDCLERSVKMEDRSEEIEVRSESGKGGEEKNELRGERRPQKGGARGGF